MTLNDATSKSVKHAIGNAFSRAGDRDGGRPFRIAKKQLEKILSVNGASDVIDKNKPRTSDPTLTNVIPDSPYQSMDDSD